MDKIFIQNKLLIYVVSDWNNRDKSFRYSIKIALCIFSTYEDFPGANSSQSNKSLAKSAASQEVVSRQDSLNFALSTITYNCFLTLDKATFNRLRLRNRVGFRTKLKITASAS